MIILLAFLLILIGTVKTKQIVLVAPTYYKTVTKRRKRNRKIKHFKIEDKEFYYKNTVTTADGMEWEQKPLPFEGEKP